jgi:hypothetical protein
MSRLICSLAGDEDCIAGYDQPLESFFFQSGKEDRHGRPKILLGDKPGAHPSIASLEQAIAQACPREPFSFDEPSRAALAASATKEIVAAESAGVISSGQAGKLLGALWAPSGQGGSHGAA